MRVLVCSIMLLQFTACTLYQSDAKKFFETDGVAFFLGEFLDTSSSKSLSVSNDICESSSQLQLQALNKSENFKSCTYVSKDDHRIFCIQFNEQNKGLTQFEILISQLQSSRDYSYHPQTNKLNYLWQNDAKEQVKGTLIVHEDHLNFCTVSPFDQHSDSQTYLDHALKLFE